MCEFTFVSLLFVRKLCNSRNAHIYTKICKATDCLLRSLVSIWFHSWQSLLHICTVLHLPLQDYVLWETCKIRGIILKRLAPHHCCWPHTHNCGWSHTNRQTLTIFSSKYRGLNNVIWGGLDLYHEISNSLNTIYYTLVDNIMGVSWRKIMGEGIWQHTRELGLCSYSQYLVSKMACLQASHDWNIGGGGGL